MDTNAKIKQLMGEVFDAVREGIKESENSETCEKLRSEFVFHMTDWASDLEKLTNLYKHPEKSEIDPACNLVIGFLYHVIPHLNAAGHLLLGEIPDAFAPSPTKPKGVNQKGTRFIPGRRTKRIH